MVQVANYLTVAKIPSKNKENKLSQKKKRKEKKRGIQSKQERTSTKVNNKFLKSMILLQKSLLLK